MSVLPTDSSDWQFRAMEAERRVEFLEGELAKERESRHANTDLARELREVATDAARRQVREFAADLMHSIDEVLDSYR